MDYTPAMPTIGFVSTRLAGTDGVSLETEKWATVLERMGAPCCYFAGQVTTPPERSVEVPEAFFGHPDIADMQQVAFAQTIRPPRLTRCIRDMTTFLKAQIAAFVRQFDVAVLVVENALTIPMHIPLGLALTEYIAETGIPTIAHHHDFFWERTRFLNNCVEDYLAMSFPPRLPSIRHVTINSLAARELSHRTGMVSTIVPNVMEFERRPAANPSAAQSVRTVLRIPDDRRLVLQPTRIVARKGIEHAIELLGRLETPAQLVISHASGDEGDSYAQRIRDYAALLGVPLTLAGELVAAERSDDNGTVCTLADVYQAADLVTYPSQVEGFGNAFLEAVYFRRPLIINSYPIFVTDIQPLGFQVIAFDGYITDATVQRTEAVLQEPERARAMVEHNYRLACAHFSYNVLEHALRGLLHDLPQPHRRQFVVSAPALRDLIQSHSPVV